MGKSFTNCGVSVGKSFINCGVSVGRVLLIVVFQWGKVLLIMAPFFLFNFFIFLSHTLPTY